MSPSEKCIFTVEGRLYICITQAKPNEDPLTPSIPPPPPATGPCNCNKDGQYDDSSVCSLNGTCQYLIFLDMRTEGLGDQKQEHEKWRCDVDFLPRFVFVFVSLTKSAYCI